MNRICKIIYRRERKILQKAIKANQTNEIIVFSWNFKTKKYNKLNNNNILLTKCLNFYYKYQTK